VAGDDEDIDPKEFSNLILDDNQVHEITKEDGDFL
jgi:hypothetical protein